MSEKISLDSSGGSTKRIHTSVKVIFNYIPQLF